MSALMMIMAVVSSLLVSFIFGFSRYKSQGTITIERSFIIVIAVICISIGAIISGIDALIEMMNYHG